MSKYTTQLRWVVEQSCADAGHDPTPDNWKDAYKRLGLDDYPIFNEAYRDTLNSKIIRRYYVREIGMETVGLFAFYMRERMYDVMTYYNQLYKSQELVTDPLKSESMTYKELWERDNTGSLSETTSGTSKGVTESATETSDRNVFSDTPMDMLQDTPSKVENLEYASNVTYDDSNSETHSQSDGTTSGKRDNETTGNETGSRTRAEDGYRIPQADLLEKYRKTFLNIDEMVVNELGDLFMTVY